MLAAPILITGGLGFLGSNLASRLSVAGEAVRLLARPRPGLAADGGHEVVWADIRDGAAVERAVSGSEVVIHLVSNFRQGGSDDKEAREINVLGTRNVLAACRRAGVSQLVHCSTIGVHGDVLEVPANEETPFNPTDLYQTTKMEAEKEVWDFSRRTGLPVTVVRPISIFGPGDRRMLKLFRMIQRGRFVMVGDGSPLFQPAHVEDVVEVFRLCLRNPAAIGEAFIAGDEEYLDRQGQARARLQPPLLAARGPALDDRLVPPAGLAVRFQEPMATGLLTERVRTEPL